MDRKKRPESDIRRKEAAGTEKKASPGFWPLLFLQLAVLIYTCAGMTGKFAAAEPLLSPKFILLYAGEVILLGVYAIIWQQLIKRIDLSIAYANRSINLLWSMLFAVWVFHEKITPANLIGSIIVIIGIILVNSGVPSGKEKP